MFVLCYRYCRAITSKICAHGKPHAALLTEEDLQLFTEASIRIPTHNSVTRYSQILVVQPKASLTFSKCLEMGLQNHTETISKVAEVAGKEFSIEQVSSWIIFASEYMNSISQCALQFVVEVHKAVVSIHVHNVEWISIIIMKWGVSWTNSIWSLFPSPAQACMCFKVTFPPSCRL